MYVDTSHIFRNGKTYTRHLLRNAYREGGKVKHDTLANLSACSEEEIAAIKLALKHKGKLKVSLPLGELEMLQGKSIGAVWCLLEVAKRLSVAKVLGNTKQGKLALWQVLARLIDQGSRLSAVRLAESHAGCEVLGIEQLNEEALYQNLTWLAEQQESIEKKLFAERYGKAAPSLFLYDVTSSYLEGEQNALAAYGYNRDKKEGKKQIVIGLLTAPDGTPVAVRVFSGNTNDPKTVAEQVSILSLNFGVQEVTLVGDRGMLKGPQIEDLPEGFHYLTAITKPQIRTMLTKGILQYELFSEALVEVEHENVRYILRRNPVRASELHEGRKAKLQRLASFIRAKTKYLAEHPRAKLDIALHQVNTKIKGLALDAFCSLVAEGRTLLLQIDKELLHNFKRLDGCYALKTDVARTSADTATIHQRYKDLAQVERAFRTMKSGHLEIRPVFVRKELNTRGHVFVVMLAYLIRRELEAAWQSLDITVEEGLKELSNLCVHTLTLAETTVSRIPTPCQLGIDLCCAAHILLPKSLPLGSPKVATTKKLPSERKAI